MSLTDGDKSWIRDTIVEALEEVVLPRFDEHDRRFDVIEADIAVLKTDVAVLKTDVAVLKTDVAESKTDIRSLQQDMREVKTTLSSLEGRVIAMEADIKELYTMQTGQQNVVLNHKKFAKLSLEDKILVFHAELLKMAKQANVTLPRQ